MPFTPGWDVLALLAHLTGAGVDLAGDAADDWSLEHWTRGHVEARAGRTRTELLAEWAMVIDGVVDRVDDPAAYGLDEAFDRMPIIDVVGHEHDIAEAAGVSIAIETEDWAVVGEHRRSNLDYAIAEAGLDPLCVRTYEGDEWLVGGDGPRHEVTLPRHELWRSLTGRRTRRDVAGYEWSCDPAPYVAAWVGGTFRWPSFDEV